MNKTIALMISYILLFFGILASRTIAWENEATHPAITEEAIKRSVLGSDYLQTQLGLDQKLNTKLELIWNYQSNLMERASQARPRRIWDITKKSILDLLKEGSEYEDIPNPRARHHFYDPIRNTGLDNSHAGDIASILWLGSKSLYPTYWGFDATGGSAIKRALGCADDWGVSWESEPEYASGGYNWPHARIYFYNALTCQQKADREKWLATVFVMLGHVCHLIEDMGVPAHTRNDFVWGHLVAHKFKSLTGVADPWSFGGHPFEAWMEMQINNNGGSIPSVYLSRLMDTPPALSKFQDYWDTGVCESSGVTQWQGDSTGWPNYGFGNPPPEKSWGLSECTNYQFLSYSTICGNYLMKQSFPHPAQNHTRVDWYSVNGRKQYYRIGYEVPHLTRVTYISYILGYSQADTDTTEERKVYEDYAKRTISRTVDYTTGLVNYFFRGRLNADVSSVDGDDVRVNIVNNSSNSGVSQILKGGTFKLYWDDANGYRTKVSDFTVNGWNSGSTLAYDSNVIGTFEAFELPDDVNEVNCILVYKGSICQNPANPDMDDLEAIAIGRFIYKATIDAVVMCWIDESRSGGGSLVTYYSNEPLYNSHLTQYRQVCENKMIRSGCLVPPNPNLSGTIADVLPQGYSAPNDISVETCGRPPTEAELIDDFNYIRNGLVPKKLLLSVDNSGSMTSGTIQPGYNDFVDWVEENYPDIEIVERTFNKQDWVNEMRSAIEDNFD